MAEALTIALILEAKDKASEWIDRVRENVDKLAERAEEASKEVSQSADQMTASLERTDAASTSATDASERQTVASTESATATRDQAAASDEATLATDKQTESTQLLGDKSEESTAKVISFDKAIAGLTLAFVAVAAVGVKMAIDFQNSTAVLAGQAGITSQAADNIGNAFLAMGGQTTFTSAQMMQAFAPISGQFVTMYGKALDAGKSVEFMNAAMTLAEATGGDLTSTTSTLATVLEVFHLKIDQAASAGNVLFNTSRLLGVSSDTYGTALTRLMPKIAGSGISLKQLSGFVVELSKSAGSGRTAIRLVGSTIQSLVSPSSSALTTLTQLGVTVDNSKGKFVGLSSFIGQLHDALAKLPATQKDVTELQKAYKLQTEEATLAAGPQTKATKTQISALSTQISALNMSTKAFSQTTVMQQLFGKNAALVAQLVAQGVPGLNHATTAVSKSGEAAKAAALKQATFEGELEKLKSAAESIFIELGQKLLPALTHLAGETVKVVNGIIGWTQRNQTLTKIILGVVGGVLALYEGIKVVTIATAAWTAAQTALDVAFSASAFGLVILAIAALIAEIVLLVKYWRDIYNAGYDTRVALVNAWNDVASWFDSNVVQPIRDFFQSLWDWLTGAAATSWHGILSVWDAVASWFNSTVIQPVVGFFTAMWDGLVTAAVDSWHGILSVWDAVASWFESTVIKPTEDFFVAMWDAVTSAAATAWHGVLTAWDAAASWFNSTIIGPIERFFEAMWDAITSAAAAAWHGILAVWDAVASWFNANVTEPVAKFFVTVWDGITAGAVAAWDGVVLAWDAVASWFDATVIQPIEGFFKRLWDDITGGATKAVSSLQSALSGVASALNPVSAFEKALGVIGMAQGGIVSAPTLAVVGEAGPEMVIPLSQLPGGMSAVSGGVSPLPLGGSSGSSGTVIQVNVTLAGQVYGSLEQLANALGRQLATITVPGSGTRLSVR